MEKIQKKQQDFEEYKKREEKKKELHIKNEEIRLLNAIKMQKQQK